MHLLLLYILSAALAVLFRYPDARSSLVYALPIFVSMLVPPAIENGENCNNSQKYY
jgi:spore germination protein GerM